MNASHYTIIIQWSEEDEAFVVSLPEWRDRVVNPVTHGESYEQAAVNAQDVIELLVESALGRGEPLPELDPVASKL